MGSCRRQAGKPNTAGLRQVADFADVEDQIALGIDVKGRSEAAVPDELIVTVRVAGKHVLVEAIVIALEKDEDLGLAALEVGCGQAEKGAVAVDGMHDGPGQREEGDLFALQPKQLVTRALFM